MGVGHGGASGCLAGACLREMLLRRAGFVIEQHGFTRVNGIELLVLRSDS